jgi:ribosomal protein S18 acetylase RimI-like enzyme
MFIRTAGERDLPAIRALLVETWHATYDQIYGAARVTEVTDEWHSLESLQRRIERPYSEFIVADDGETIGGMAYAESNADGKLVWLRQLYVLPALHGKGIGGMLMDEILDAFPDAETVRLDVNEKNTRAIDFYQGYGFIQTGSEIDLDGRTQNLFFERRLAEA